MPEVTKFELLSCRKLFPLQLETTTTYTMMVLVPIPVNRGLPLIGLKWCNWMLRFDFFDQCCYSSFSSIFLNCVFPLNDNARDRTAIPHPTCGNRSFYDMKMKTSQFPVIISQQRRRDAVIWPSIVAVLVFARKCKYVYRLLCQYYWRVFYDQIRVQQSRRCMKN